VNWIDLPEDTDRWRDVVNTAMSLWVAQNATNFLTGWGIVGFRRRTGLRGVSYVIPNRVA